MSNEEYRHTTHDLTLNLARLLVRLNPETTFCYVTGAGTDSSEQGRIAWARVKGATENALARLFKQAYMFRPGFMKATSGRGISKATISFLAGSIPLAGRSTPPAFCTLAGSWAGYDQCGPAKATPVGSWK